MTLLQSTRSSQNNGLSSASTSHAGYPIIVHSHLRWDWVWQRPQQFLSRLSKRHRILFVEGPFVTDEVDEPKWSCYNPEGYPRITVMQMHFPASRWGAEHGEWVDSERLRLLREALAGPLKELLLKDRFATSDSSAFHVLERPIQWFYDPMAVTAFAGHMNERAVVYDCMDELSQFKHCPPELIARERELLKVADVVFAGGRKMHESKSRYNSNCHFYGCGVDVEHFGKARLEETALPEDLQAIKERGPVLGFFGVVDERMDYELLAKLADNNPNWQIAIVGPMTKVEESDLPQRENIHWLGGRSYDQLPAYTKGFDICMMSFARNEATEYINPTKALEYMATGKPIVSTAVPDVVSNFSQVVKIAHSHEEFITFCEAILARPDEVAVKRGLNMANQNTWDAIVAKLEGHIEDALQAKRTRDSRTVYGVATSEVADTAAAASAA